MWSNSGKDKYHLISLTYVNLKNDTNELIHKILTDWDIDNKLMVTKRERGRDNKLGVWN